MHFDPTITLGNLFTIVMLFVTVLIVWRDLDWRVKNIEDWKASHEHSTTQALENITFLKTIAGKMEVMIAGQDRRLQIIEDRERRTRPH